MNLFEQLDAYLHDTLHVSLPAFGPELAICATILLMLVIRVLPGGNRFDSFYVALVGMGVALWWAAPWDAHTVARQEIFTGLLVYDPWTAYFRGFLATFALLFLIFCKISGIVDREDSPDFYTLVLGGLLGMCLMAASNHLLMVFLGVEMASVPSYVLAGIIKSRRDSSEAALKYAVYGAGTAGIMLYGISLLGGLLGSVHLPTMAHRLAELLMAAENSGGDLAQGELLVLALGGLMLAVGLAFKLSAVPFHFWCPDVFEGATAEVNAFLSVASKAAALALLVRVAFGMTSIPTPAVEVEPPVEVAGFFAVADEPVEGESPSDVSASTAEAETPPSLETLSPEEASSALAPARTYVAGLIALLAAITCTFGNLAAYGQTNIKRLLAYSTIAHAGYMMMPAAAAVVLIGRDPVNAQQAVASIATYVGIYLFMNLGAFAVIAFLRNTMGSEEIADYAGLVRKSPGVVVCFALILFSLVGLPPLAGFLAKFEAFAALANAEMWTLLAIGGLNTVISLFYYLRVVKVMAMSPEPDHRAPFRFSLVSVPGAYVVAMTLPLVVLILGWDTLQRLTLTAASRLLS